ncbi:MAG: GGDEF domain-containing protein [Defluviitaleaceae bacterium]|nr:GGDEF domain-containing protein [Defluviitaleaceae bacterium]
MKKIFKRYLADSEKFERKISFIFFFSVFMMCAAAIPMYVMMGSPSIVIIPTAATLILSIVVPALAKGDDYRYAMMFMGYVLYLFLPFVFFFTGGLGSPVMLFFVSGLFMFSVFLRGKIKKIAIAAIAIEYAAVIYAGTKLSLELRGDGLARGFIFIISFLMIVFIAYIVTSILSFVNTKEKERTESLLAELHAKNAELDNLAKIDPLTGCYNRRYLYEHCNELIPSSSESETALCVFIIDIDFFKQINDTHGHSVGDTILKLMVHLIRMAIRINDLLIRYGGEEFVILLPNCGIEIASQIAERIRSLVEGNRNRENVHFTVSIGIAELRLGEDMESLIRRADENMYIAKNTGRNRVVA